MNYSDYLKTLDNVPSLHAVFAVAVDRPGLGLKANDRVIYADGPQGTGLYDARRVALALAPADVQFVGYAPYADMSKETIVDHPFLASKVQPAARSINVQTPEPEIVLGKDLQLRTADGRQVAVISIGSDKDGYAFVPLQVYLVDDGRSDGNALCQDPVFIAGVMAHLKTIGFEGEPFGRSERGMQSLLSVSLDPGSDFVKWLTEAHGWNDLDDDAPGGLSPMSQR